MLKRKIDAAAYEALSADLKAAYWKSGEEYLLKIEGDDDNDAPELKRAKDREKQRADAAEAKLKKFEDAEREALANADANKEKIARESGDWATLEQSWKDKLAAAEKAGKDATKKLEGHLRKVLVDSTAANIAGEISTTPKLLQDQIAKRMTVELTDDGPVVRILDAAGKPSALSADDLKKEFVDNADFKGVIKDTLASGGGANKRDAGNPVNGVHPVSPVKPDTNLAKIDGKTLAATIKGKADARLQG